LASTTRPAGAIIRAVRWLAPVICLVAGVHVAVDGFADDSLLATVVQRASERVERYLARAQTIVCLEIVHLQPLNSGWTGEGFGRTVESELRVSWKPEEDGTPTTDAQTLRQLLKVNGHKPRKDDWDNCTTPEQESEEPQALALLLPSQREDYRFVLAGEGKVDRRTAIMIDYQLVKVVSVESRLVDGREDCIRFNLEGGMRGRLWVDAETFDVLRLDQRLSTMVEIPLPKAARRRGEVASSWTMERWDTSIRFKPVTFSNPDETLVVPASVSSLRIMRGSGAPRLRTTTDYKNYQRFLTGSRVVGE